MTKNAIQAVTTPKHTKTRHVEMWHVETRHATSLQGFQSSVWANMGFVSITFGEIASLSSWN